jgi:hypothetical protein
MRPKPLLRIVTVCALLAALQPNTQGRTNEGPLPQSSKFPYSEKLSFRIEWRLITAGTATLNLKKTGNDIWDTDLKIESAGVLTRLYPVLDSYRVAANSNFCPASAVLDAREGKRHYLTRLTFDGARHRVRTEQRDLVNNTSTGKDLEAQPCTYEIVGALYALRLMNFEPGKSATIPVTDGKKVVNARIDNQARETVSFGGKSYQTLRYEAYLFDNILYRRRGRLFIWVTDDKERIPVQFRVQMGFPVGSVTVQLEKDERL